MFSLAKKTGRWNIPIFREPVKHHLPVCYYGTRYYDPRTSVWLSVDPLAEKYPNISSYVYCMDNPLVFIDYDERKPASKQQLTNRLNPDYALG